MVHGRGEAAFISAAVISAAAISAEAISAAGHFGGGRFGGRNQFAGGRQFGGRSGFNRNAFGTQGGWNRFAGNGGGGGWGGWGGGWGGWGGWVGPVFWPFLLGDVFSYALWPYDYYYPFWSYGTALDYDYGPYVPAYGYNGYYGYYGYWDIHLTGLGRMLGGWSDPSPASTTLSPLGSFGLGSRLMRTASTTWNG